MDAVNTPAKFEVRSFTRSWDNRGYSKNWAVPGNAHAHCAVSMVRTAPVCIFALWHQYNHCTAVVSPTKNLYYE